MTTAVDTCVLLDLLLDEPLRAARAEQALRDSALAGRVVVGEVVYAELMPQFATAGELDEVLDRLSIEFVGSSATMAAVAGQAFAECRRRGSKRDRIIGDFLVGAHALVHADRLLTGDRRFYTRDFEALDVIEP